MYIFKIMYIFIYNTIYLLQAKINIMFLFNVNNTYNKIIIIIAVVQHKSDQVVRSLRVFLQVINLKGQRGHHLRKSPSRGVAFTEII